MKKEKKVYSLVTKEVFNIITSSIFVVLGVLKLINPQNPIGQLVITVLVWCFVASFILSSALQIFMKFDIEDEAAVEHYNKAKRKIFDFVWGFCFGFGGVGAILTILLGELGVEITKNLTVNIGFLHFMFVYFLIQLAISTYFIYFEKREA